MPPHSFNTKNAGPNRRQCPFDVIARQDTVGFVRLQTVRHGKRAPINFAIRRQRQALEKHKAPRDHVIWQLALQKRFQLTGLDRHVILRHNVSYQTLVSRLILSGGYARIITQGLCDLFRLDTKSVNLYLIVCASEKFNSTIGQMAG